MVLPNCNAISCFFIALAGTAELYISCFCIKCAIPLYIIADPEEISFFRRSMPSWAIAVWWGFLDTQVFLLFAGVYRFSDTIISLNHHLSDNLSALFHADPRFDYIGHAKRVPRSLFTILGCPFSDLSVSSNRHTYSFACCIHSYLPIIRHPSCSLSRFFRQQLQSDCHLLLYVPYGGL